LDFLQNKQELWEATLCLGSLLAAKAKVDGAQSLLSDKWW